MGTCLATIESSDSRVDWKNRRPAAEIAPVFFILEGQMGQQPIIIRRKQADINTDALLKVSEILKTVSHGSITLIVQGGRVFQINKTENCKLPKTGTD